jgi:prepilin-type N-terminal cleavage/methylation domain-containing protein
MSTPHIEKKVNNMKIQTTRKSGFTLVEIMIVVAIIGLLAAIAIPNFVKARTTAQRNACIANLKQIDGANQQWALENKKTDSDTVDAAGSVTYLKGGVAPTCPAGGSYTIAVTVSNPPTCNLGATLGHSLP